MRALSCVAVAALGAALQPLSLSLRPRTRLLASPASVESPFEDPTVRISLRSAFSGVRADVARRAPHYLSDWTSGLRAKKTYAASSFLYFTCLAPVVAFGGLVSSITRGEMGVVEYLLSCGCSGVAYALLAGQPMTLLGPTGLTLAFIATLFRFADARGLPFLPMYACTGLWTSLFLALASALNLCNLMRFCTRFTDDCFNALLVLNFLYEAGRSLTYNFIRANTPTAMVSALASLNVGLATWQLTLSASRAPQTRALSRGARKAIAAAGPTVVILAMSALVAHPRMRSLGIPTLVVPASFALGNGRQRLLVDVAPLPPRLRMLCALPALLLTMLFYLDQNISVRAASRTGLRKGSAYHLDLLVLALVVGALSACGLPWTCAATVQSLNHVRALSTVALDQDGREVFSDTLETRLVGLLVHAAILASLLLLPYMALIPMPVISGIFLFLGQKLTGGNLYLERMGQVLDEKRLLPSTSAFRQVGAGAMARFLALQSSLLALIWALKQSRSLSLFFPGCVLLLMLTRQLLVPAVFSPREVLLLDPPDDA